MKNRIWITLLVLVGLLFQSQFVYAFGASSLFFGSGDGRIGWIDPATGDVTVSPSLGLALGDVNALTFDASGSLWGNIGGTGVGEFNTNTGSFSLLVNPEDGMGPVTVNSLTFGASSVFFGSGDGRIGWIDPATGNVTVSPSLGLALGDVNALTFDASGSLWGNIGGTGVGEFNTNTGSFSLLVNPEDGMGPVSIFALATNPVPEPGSLGLICSALVGVFIFTRRAT